jgi:hypothetical protein
MIDLIDIISSDQHASKNNHFSGCCAGSVFRPVSQDFNLLAVGDRQGNRFTDLPQNILVLKPQNIQKNIE